MAKIDKDFINSYLLQYGNYFPADSLEFVRQTLSEQKEDVKDYIVLLPLRNPDTFLITSLVAGVVGIDRFLLGDTGLGIGKLLTGGGCGIWAIVDWFLIQKDTRIKNLNDLLALINGRGAMMGGPMMGQGMGGQMGAPMYGGQAPGQPMYGAPAQPMYGAPNTGLPVQQQGMPMQQMNPMNQAMPPAMAPPAMTPPPFAAEPSLSLDDVKPE